MYENVDKKLPLKKVLVVLDPTRMMQPALMKGERVARLSDAALHLYCGVYDADQAEEISSQRRYVELTRDWVERLADNLRAKGFTATVEVDWTADWREGVRYAASRSEADLVIKTASRRRGLARRLMNVADWSLVRKCPCPVMLVNTGEPWRSNRVLAAVKLKPRDEDHVLLNEKVLEVTHSIADALKAELHAGTVHRGDEIFFDRQRFADSCRLPRHRVHATEGTSYSGIAEIADSIGADLIVVGSMTQAAPGRGLILGDTVQRLIGSVDADIVVLPSSWNLSLAAPVPKVA